MLGSRICRLRCLRIVSIQIHRDLSERQSGSHPERGVSHPRPSVIHPRRGVKHPAGRRLLSLLSRSLPLICRAWRVAVVLNPKSGAAAGIWTRVRGLGGFRRDSLLVSVLDQVTHRLVAVLDHGLVEALVLTHPRSGPWPHPTTTKINHKTMWARYPVARIGNVNAKNVFFCRQHRVDHESIKLVHS